MKRPILLVLCAAGCLAQPQVEGTASNALTGQPLARVHVLLRLVEKSYGAVTTPEGRFSMTSLPPGDYEVTAERVGYVPSKPLQLTLEAGDHKRDLELKMLPAAAISGRVVDDGGNPMMGLLVTAIRGSDAGSNPTSEEGAFRVEGLRPGKYLLRASHIGPGTRPEIRSDGTREINYGPTYYPGVADVAAAVALEVKAGAEVSGVEIRMVAQPILHLSGRVTGAPANEGDILVEDSLGEGARVRPDGGFMIWRVTPGTHVLTALSYGRDGGVRTGPAEVTVGDSSVENVELTVVPPFSVAGKIEGWKGGESFLHLNPLGRRDGGEQIAAISAAGSFRLPNPLPALYRLRIEKLADNTYIKRVRAAAVDMAEGLLDLCRGDPHDEVTIELAMPAAHVGGTVSDFNGPVPGALVALFPEGKHADALRILATAGPDGKYSVTGLAPGKYAVLALPALEPNAVAQYDRHLQTIDLSEGDTMLKDLTVTVR